MAMLELLGEKSMALELVRRLPTLLEPLGATSSAFSLMDIGVLTEQLLDHRVGGDATLQHGPHHQLLII